MKIIPSILLILLSACHTNPSVTAAIAPQDTSFTIKGQINGIEKGIAILNYITAQQVRADTSTIVNGHFAFSGRLEQSQEVQVSFINDGYNGAITFFAENAAINIVSDIADLSAPAIAGSISQKDFETFKKQLLPVSKKMEQLNIAGHGIFEAGKLTKATADSLYVLFKVLENEKTSIISSFVKEHPASVVSAWAISKNLLSDPKIETLEPVFNMLSPENKAGLYGGIVYETILAEKATATGRMAIAFTLPDSNNKPVSLDSFKGKYLLVDFWASWCGPCRKENPNVRQAYTKFKTKGFEILGVSLDTDKDAWIKAIGKDQLDWPQVSDLKGWKSTVSTNYGIRGIPFNVLLDKNGVIIAKNLRGDALENKLKEVLQ